MSQLLSNSHRSGSVAIVGKSSLFPVSLTPRAFWPNLLSLSGLMSGLARGRWPFGEFLQAEDLERLKAFVMESGLLAGGGLPADGFEIPPEVLPLAKVFPLVVLYLAEQALEDSGCGEENGPTPERMRVVFETRMVADAAPAQEDSRWRQAMQDEGLEDEVIRKIAARVDRKGEGTASAAAGALGRLDQLFAQHHGCEAVALDRAPLPGTATWLNRAIGLLQQEEVDLVVAGGVDSVQALPVWADDVSTGKPDVMSYQEGMGMITLRRLEDAERDGDRIHAVITGIEGSRVLFRSSQRSATAAETDGTGRAAVDDRAAGASSPEERLAAFARIGPEDLALSDEGLCRNLPFNPLGLAEVATAAPTADQGKFSWKLLRECWVERTGSRRFFHDLLGVLFGTFVHRVVVQDPDRFDAVADQPVVYLANHQIGLESPLFMALSFGMTGVPIQAVAKPDHVNAWLSFLLAFAEDSLGDCHPFRLLFFDRQNPQGLIDSLKQGGKPEASLLVHVEGTRALAADQPVTKISSIFLDMAIEKGVPMVPVRFVGGLPREATGERYDFPFGNGKQDYLLGTPILPEELKKLPYGQRPKFVMDRINTLGPAKNEDVLLPPNPAFESKTRFFMETFGFPKIQAMLFAILQEIDDPCEETAVLVKAVQAGKIDPRADNIPPALKNFLGHMKTKFS